MTLTDRDRQRLSGVDPGLAAVVELASQRMPLFVIEGVRSRERQAKLYAQGRTEPGKIVTWTLDSKHCDGLAVDIAPLPWNPADMKAFFALAGVMFACAQSLGYRIRFGGDWDGDGVYGERGETDAVHYERQK